jgi:uncharacterized protein
VALICDTGPLYAAMDQSDRDHSICAEFLEHATEALLVPASVVVELDWLSSRRLGPTPFLEFLSDVGDERLQVVDLLLEDYRRTRQLMDRYRDLPLGFVDATVVAIAERLGEPKVMSFDRRHFGVVRPRHAPSLRLVP